MTRLVAIALTALGAMAPRARAQSSSALIARTGVRTDSPHAGTYRYLEFYHASGPWILPDVGALDFYSANYVELFAGASFFFGAAPTRVDPIVATWYE